MWVDFKVYEVVFYCLILFYFIELSLKDFEYYIEYLRKKFYKNDIVFSKIYMIFIKILIFFFLLKKRK